VDRGLSPCQKTATSLAGHLSYPTKLDANMLPSKEMARIRLEAGSKSVQPCPDDDLRTAARHQATFSHRWPQDRRGFVREGPFLLLISSSAPRLLVFSDVSIVEVANVNLERERERERNRGGGGDERGGGGVKEAPACLEGRKEVRN
jgi:hypothetical protein